MQQVKTLEFCTLTFHKNYVVSVINEGVNINKERNQKLIDIINDFYDNKPYVYISHRINSYSVDPHIYPKTVKIKTLIGMAVVSKDYKAKVNAEIEKMFFNKPFDFFSTLEEAFTWSNELIA